MKTAGLSLMEDSGVIQDTTRLYLAIAEAVREAIDIVGVSGVRKMSMFPSSERVLLPSERAPVVIRELEAA